MLTFDCPDEMDFEDARLKRNEDISGFRTPRQISESAQEDFAEHILKAPDARFWAIRRSDRRKPVALVGLERIEWENGNAETSVVFIDAEDEERRAIFRGLLAKGFAELRLTHIYTQVYLCSPLLDFYLEQAEALAGTVIDLPIGKYWAGIYHGSKLVVFAR